MNKYLIILLLLVSCEKIEEEDTTYEQNKRIEAYLESRGSEYIIIDGVYKSEIPEPDPEPDPDPDPDPEVSKTLMKVQSKVPTVLELGDTVYIYYAQLLFTDKPSLLYNTNVESLALEAGMQKDASELAPLKIIYGESKIIDGLSRGLKNSVEKELFELYIPSEFAYGSMLQGVLPQHSTIQMYVEIYKIDKK